MKIATGKGLINTDVDSIVFMFKDDEEFSSFLTKLVKLEIKKGVRVLPIIADSNNLSDIQKSILSVIESVDGINSDNVREKTEDANNKLTEIIRKYS